MLFGKKKAKDPICGMNVDEKTATYKSEYGGKTYYFCAAACKSTFDNGPHKYVSEATRSPHEHHECC
jgi:YHS domain-containing protein